MGRESSHSGDNDSSRVGFDRTGTREARTSVSDQVISFANKVGDSLAIGPVGIDSSAAINLFGISKEQIQNAGLQVRNISVEQASRIQLVAPAQFGKDDRERDAARLFMKLFAKDKRN
jgi:hypothetical protein